MTKTFKQYIRNWSNNFKNYKLPENYICDITKEHIRTCKICRKPISFYTICQDKYLSQIFVSKLGWKIPKLYFNGDIESLTKDIVKSFPENYVMKKTHGEGSKECMCVLEKKIINRKRQPSLKFLKKKFRDSFVICEEYLIDKTSKQYPIDYKCYVFDGKIKYINIIQKDNKSANLYSIDFKKRFKYHSVKNNLIDILPSSYALNIMKKYCKDLSMFKGLFIRVDFYIINNEVYFGEFTPNPNNGFLYSEEMLSYLDRDIKNLYNN